MSLRKISRSCSERSSSRPICGSRNRSEYPGRNCVSPMTARPLLMIARGGRFRRFSSMLSLLKESSRPRHEIVDDALFAGLVEIDGELVAFHRAHAPVAEFLVENALAELVLGSGGVARLDRVRLRLDQRRA